MNRINAYHQEVEDPAEVRRWEKELRSRKYDPKMEIVKDECIKFIQEKYGWVDSYVLPLNKCALHAIHIPKNSRIGHIHYVTFYVHDRVHMQVFEIDRDLDKEKYTGRHVTLWSEQLWTVEEAEAVFKRLFE